MNGKPTHDTPPIQSLDRGLAILEAVAASTDPVPLKHLTELIGIDRSSVFRLANTLRQRRFLANPQGSKDYILAARVLGFGRWRIIFRHALPNIITSSIVFSMSDFVLNILLVSGLSFLGLGIAPPEPEWGAMIAESKDYMRQAWWVTTMPALAIVLTGTALSLIGDGLAQRFGESRRGLL